MPNKHPKLRASQIKLLTLQSPFLRTKDLEVFQNLLLHTPMQSTGKSSHFWPQNVSRIKTFLIRPLWFKDTSLSCLGSRLLTASFPVCFHLQMSLSTAVRVSPGNVNQIPSILCPSGFLSHFDNKRNPVLKSEQWI